ncbi:hydrolase [Nostoc sp. MBR 210]|nr:hydrolase [Nostoc sp. MBR 210]
MMGISHLLISGTAVGMITGTADPSVLVVGAIAGLMPDVDISTSPAGRVLPWVSAFFEERMPHRSCTHSLVASCAIALFSYSVVLIVNAKLIVFAHALTIGYTFGWFSDVFTRGGVEMFWPSSVRCVCPGNREFRLRTGSNIEYFILVILIAIALGVFNVNNSGGLFNQFNRLIASPSGVQKIYNESGSTNLIKANIKGVMTSDRTPVKNQFLIIQAQGKGFLVQDDKGKIYKASTEPDAQIFLEEITADVGQPAITNIQAIFLEDEPVNAILEKFNNTNTFVFVTGTLTVEDTESINIPRDPYQFPYFRSTTNTINLEAAPLKTVLKAMGEEFATGQLQIKIINMGRNN